jgi:hypothetical protein
MHKQFTTSNGVLRVTDARQTLISYLFMVAIAILTQYIPVEILGQDLERINQCELQL